MKFRHRSNFIELDLNDIILNLITIHQNRAENISKLLAGILLKEDVESILERMDYVKVESAN